MPPESRNIELQDIVFKRARRNLVKKGRKSGLFLFTALLFQEGIPAIQLEHRLNNPVRGRMPIGKGLDIDNDLLPHGMPTFYRR